MPDPETALTGRPIYRPDVDGLRAISVLAVILYHANLGCPGGYVGVDVFFVISGYLITSLIWSELQQDRFSFVGFWERRVRRIMPALVVVTLATMAASCLLLLPGDLAKLGQAVQAQSIFAANVFYHYHSGYFAGESGEIPLIHTWSLAVEEQFYLIVPILLWGLCLITALRKSFVAPLVLGTLFVISLAISVHWLTRHPTASFYLLPSRAWELLLGSLLVYIPAAWPSRISRTALEISAIVGLALILVPVFTYGPKTAFPGAAALVPCVGAALLIWTIGRAGSAPRILIGTLLSLRPMVFLGLISYSLYLWHWPFLAIGDYICVGPFAVPYRLAMLGMGLICAVLSWRFVETPFRQRQLGSSRRAMFIYAGSGVAALLAVGLLLDRMHGLPGRLTPERLALASTDAESQSAYDVSLDNAAVGNFIPLGNGAVKAHPSVLVWGDSHAMAALPAIDALLQERKSFGCAATHSSTAPVIGWYAESRFGLGADSLAFNQHVLDYIRREHIHDVILIAIWGSYAKRDTDTSSAFRDALLDTVRRISALGSHSWVLLDVPSHKLDVPKALALPVVLGGTAPYLASVSTVNELDAGSPGFTRRIIDAGGQVLDPKPAFLDPTGAHYCIESDGRPLYRDRHHLTHYGAMQALLPLLRTTCIGETKPIPGNETAHDSPDR